MDNSSLFARRFFLFLPVFLFTAFPASLALGGTNLLADPSFEQTKPRDSVGRVFVAWGGWKFDGDCDFGVGDVSHTGKTSGLLTCTSPGKIRLSQALDLQPGRYLITAWIRGADLQTGTYNNTIEFMFDDNYVQLHKSGTFGWTRLTYVADLTKATTTGPSFGLWGPGRFWIDDVSLERISTDVELTSAPLLGTEALPTAALVVPTPPTEAARPLPSNGPEVKPGGPEVRPGGPEVKPGGPEVRPGQGSITLFSSSLNPGPESIPEEPNILANGGFETGLMCYQDWIWSQTGQDFKGDYKFSLSDDAHSGAHSLEMACTGNDCLKAGIFTDQIPTTPGQAYKLSVFSRCPPNTTSSIFIPESATGPLTQPLTCNGNWAANHLTFKSAPAAHEVLFYLFKTGTSWLRVDDVVLTYADGTVPRHRVLHPGVRDVGIAGQNVTVDGKAFMSLGFVNVGYEDLAAAAATGANTVNGLSSHSNAECFNATQPGYLDRAYSLGLNFIPDSTTTARLTVPGVFPGVIKTFAPHLSVLGWGLADEPDLIELPFTYIPPATLNAEYKAIKSVSSLPVTFDAQHAAYDHPAFLAPYAKSSDLWMAEPYGPDFGSVEHATTLFNSLHKQPIWLYQDAIDAKLIVPKTYWAIIHGVTGIHFFEWVNFKSDAARLAAATQVFGELRFLENAIFGANADTLLAATVGIGSIARYDAAADSLYILSVNPSLPGASPNVQANFTVKGLPAGKKISVMFENRAITAGAGGFSDSFTGVSRHVYRVDNFMKGTAPAPVASLEPKGEVRFLAP